MVDDNGGNSHEPVVDPDRKLAELLLPFKGQYHNHKETMAHAAMLLQIGFAAGIMSIKCWPPKWVQPIKIPKEWVAFIGFAVMWLLIHIYIWWQLKKREKAETEINDLLKNLAEANTKNKSLYQSMQDTSKGAKFAKWLLYIGSFLMLIMVLMRTLSGK